VDLDFEHNVRPAPVIAEEVTACLEEMIKKRIAEVHFGIFPLDLVMVICSASAMVVWHHFLYFCFFFALSMFLASLPMLVLSVIFYLVFWIFVGSF
jgi:hypothetical protein